MNRCDREFLRGAFQVTCWLGIPCIVLLGLILSYAWYTAGLQAEVYRRQGIAISQWEIFNGVSPLIAVQPHPEQP